MFNMTVVLMEVISRAGYVYPICFIFQSYSGERVDIFPLGSFIQQGWMLTNYEAATQVPPDCALLNNTD